MTDRLPCGCPMTGFKHRCYGDMCPWLMYDVTHDGYACAIAVIAADATVCPQRMDADGTKEVGDDGES